ncbi:kinase [Streptomyces sp. NPDC048290]|uniref:GHMP family kinase ATP-binding protein n=1 Tax=Streptomyces sp. NPDC048290 TaxID=3155811 RepID=UPI00342CD136
MTSPVSIERPIANGSSFGTFGELLQGRLQPGNRDFLVTLPIARWSTARFHWQPDQELRVEPPGKRKSLELAARMLRHYGCPGGGTLTLSGDLPEGKGLASSSADLVATARAVARVLGVGMPAATIEGLIRPIEPTDGVMHNGTTAFYHREVRLCARLGPTPPMTIVGVDEGGEIDTVSFNRKEKSFTREETSEYRRLLYSLSEAVRHGDVTTIGRVATQSSEMNQRLQHKRLLPGLLEICRKAGALGVAVAHSGTKLGILISAADPDHDKRLARVVDECHEISEEITIDHTLNFTPPSEQSTQPAPSLPVGNSHAIC